MTPEELREKVAQAVEAARLDTSVPGLWHERTADAAIRVVLEVLLAEAEKKRDYQVVGASTIRSFLPQDKQEDAA